MSAIWPAAGSADTELGVMMEPEVCHREDAEKTDSVEGAFQAHQQGIRPEERARSSQGVLTFLQLTRDH
jgi:hypothetical protein